MARNVTEHHATRRAWWLDQFARETGRVWTGELEHAVRRLVKQLKQDADDEVRAWELWQRLLAVISEIESLAPVGRPLTHVSPWPQPSLRWLEFFAAQYPPDDLRLGLRRDENRDIVSAPTPDLAPKEPTRFNEKQTDPVSRTALIFAMSGVLDKLAWMLPKQQGKRSSRAEQAKSVGGWTDRAIALASLLLGNRGDEDRSAEELLERELQTIGALHRRQLAGLPR
ncbi:MAG: hypothetical protein AMXMBFR56_47850 [Polyangiaceae bacterium]